VKKWSWWCLLFHCCKRGETLENLLPQPPLGGRTDGVHDRVVPLEIALRGFVHDPVWGSQLDEGGQGSLGLVLDGEFSEKPLEVLDENNCSNPSGV